MASLNFETIKGDTFYSVPFQINVNDTAQDLTGSNIRMQLRKECGGVIAFSPSITITNASAGEFRINEQIINCNSGNYMYDIEIAFANGVVKTWISGMFNVKCDITR